MSQIFYIIANENWFYKWNELEITSCNYTLSYASCPQKLHSQTPSTMTLCYWQWPFLLVFLTVAIRIIQMYVQHVIYLSVQYNYLYKFLTHRSILCIDSCWQNFLKLKYAKYTSTSTPVYNRTHLSAIVFKWVINTFLVCTSWK